MAVYAPYVFIMRRDMGSIHTPLYWWRMACAKRFLIKQEIGLSYHKTAKKYTEIENLILLKKERKRVGSTRGWFDSLFILFDQKL